MRIIKKHLSFFDSIITGNLKIKKNPDDELPERLKKTETAPKRAQKISLATSYAKRTCLSRKGDIFELI